MIFSSDREIVQTVLNWLNEGHQVALITVLKTWGSSPRPVGSLMAIRDDGYFTGSVSGGCVEEDLLTRVKHNQLSNSSPTTIAYGSSNQEATRLGLPCGGRIELLVEQLENGSQLETVLNKISAGELISRSVCLSTGEISLDTATAMDEFSYQHHTVKKVFGPAWQILIIGAGHLTQYMSQIAMMLDYKVIVCDPREEYQQAWTIQEIDCLSSMPDDAVKQLTNYQRSIVLTLAHDPKLDDMALMEALTVNCFYVGALGSERNNNKRRQRLAELGLTAQQLKQLHGPVGLDIGSHTPAEIAVSIMADITAARNTAYDTASNTQQKVSAL